jgi:hypothetical protein
VDAHQDDRCALRVARKKRNVLVGVLLLIAAVLFQELSLDGWGGVILPLFSESSETVYAPRYSDFAFRRVHTGMTAGEVTKLVGPPLRELLRPYGLVWVYSDSPVSRSYRRRLVIFARDGRVSEVSAGFNFD